MANNGNVFITINSGNFTHFAFDNGSWNILGSLVIKGGTFDADPSNWVDTNAYNVTEANGLWTVTAK